LYDDDHPAETKPKQDQGDGDGDDDVQIVQSPPKSSSFHESQVGLF
jgi:hypothetical protein